MSGLGADQGDRGNGRGGAALDRRAREGKPDTRWRTHCKANAQTRAGEECRCLVEHLTESLGGARAMWRTERSQGDVQLAIADADVAGSGEQLMQQGSPFLIGTGVVRSQQRKQIALGLIGNHLDDVGQVLTFGGELDDGPLVEVSDFDALGNAATLLEELRHASAGCAQLLAEPAMGDLEAPHGRPAPFDAVRGGGAIFAFEPGEISAGRTDLLIQSAALGIGDSAGRVLRLNLVIDERIEQELFSHVYPDSSEESEEIPCQLARIPDSTERDDTAGFLNKKIAAKPDRVGIGMGRLLSS